MNIFAELIHAVYDFKSYPVFRRNKGGKAFLYGLLLSVFYLLLSMLLPMLVTLVSFGGFGNVVRQSIPDFRLEDGRLWVDGTYDVQEYDTNYGGIYIKVDTERPITEEITDVDLLAFDRVLVMDDEHMIVKAEEGQSLRIAYTDLDLGDWSRDEMMQTFLPLLPAFLWFLFVVLVCAGRLGFYGSALVVAVIGSIMSAVMGCGLKFGELYKLAIYARTPALLVETVYAWIPLVISYFYVISYGVSALYMWKALKLIKEESLEPPKTGWTGGTW